MRTRTAASAVVREQVLTALRGSQQALDAYRVARMTGLAPMTAGRALVALAGQGAATCIDVRGTANDLAARYAPRPQPNAA